MTLQARYKTGLVFFPAFDWAISPTHPEREERLLYTQDQVFEEGLLDIDGIQELRADMVTAADVQRVHFCVPDLWQVMTESHFISAGGAKALAMAVADGRVERGFALVRPPGHHAMRVVHGARGFCNVNNEAIMIEYLRAAYDIDRIAIVDTDCHHGDGTQDIYWHDPDTLFISLHQDGRTLYPGSGFPREMGGPNAIGATLNIPLPPHTAEEGFLYTIENVVLPILEAFKPDLVINSAGQDNHYSDPITNMNFSAQGYARLIERLQPDISVLEGGYAIEDALPYVNAGIILAMAGIDYSHVTEPDYDSRKYCQSPEITSRVREVGNTIREIWQKKDDFKKRACGSDTFQQRRRSIYYDTDQISETQQETIRICDECAGALRIDSAASPGRHILAVHIPRKACPACRQTGRQWYESADEMLFDMILLQDRSRDTFEVRQK